MGQQFWRLVCSGCAVILLSACAVADYEKPIKSFSEATDATQSGLKS